MHVGYLKRAFPQLSKLLPDILRCDWLFSGPFHNAALYMTASVLPCIRGFRRLPHLKYRFHTDRKLFSGADMFLPYFSQRFFIASAVCGAFQGDHLPPAAPETISVLDAASDIQRLEQFQIGFIYVICRGGCFGAPVFPQLIIRINITSVNLRYTRRIFGFFHSSFYLKGVNSRLNQCRDMFDGTHVL